MKKKLLSIISVILIAVLIIPTVLGLSLQEIWGLLSGSSFSSYITFYNAKNQETSLFVKKTVESTGPEQAPEDDEFLFTLTLNDAPARDLMYTLFDKDGRKIYNYESGQTTVEDKTQFEIALKTDRYGRFTLKAGQTARFDGLRPGDAYKVTEEPQEPYIQEYPAAGGSISGTMTNDGASAVFKNLYPSGEPGKIVVRKTVSYPANYEIPETPDFKFEITVDGKKLANYEYVVKSISTGDTLSTETTNADGTFTLKGDTYAEFSNIPTDVDYEVREIIDEEAAEAGWRVSGEDYYEGATTSSGTTLSFNNVLASFGVSKEMLGGIAADAPFQFQVLNGQGKPFGSSLSYYLYDQTLQLVDEDLHKTGTDGTFTLEAGQRAIFVGLEYGTVYGVAETSSGHYVQYLPAGAKGYEGKEVGDSVEILPFVNADIPSQTLLTVKKVVVDNTEDQSAPDIYFRFRISILKNGEYVPLAKAAYDIVDANGTRTYSADADGIFQIRAWETARFVDLKKGNTYKVEELIEDFGSSAPGQYMFSPAGGVYYADGITIEDEPVQLEFTNNYDEPEDPEFLVVKEKGTTGKPLKGAVLQIVEKDENGNVTNVVHEWVSKDSAETIQAKPGTYYIREKSAPEGFEVADDIKITIEYSSEVAKFTMVDHRENEVPTGIAALRSPLVRTIITIVILLAVLAAVYFGMMRKRRRSE